MTSFPPERLRTLVRLFCLSWPNEKIWNYSKKLKVRGGLVQRNEPNMSPHFCNTYKEKLLILKKVDNIQYFKINNEKKSFQSKLIFNMSMMGKVFADCCIKQRFYNPSQAPVNSFEPPPRKAPFLDTKRMSNYLIPWKTKF